MTTIDEADFAGIRLLREQLNRMPAALVKELRPQIRRSAEPIVAAARANASWSKRIPGAIGVRVAFAGKNAGVTIRVDRKKAPHARAYEGLGTRATNFRHPLFGNTDRWVSQPVRPFLFPAVVAHRDQVLNDVAALVDRTLAVRGYKA